MEIYDLILFAGQSNMAGRGIVTDKWPQKAPVLVKGAVPSLSSEEMI